MARHSPKAWPALLLLAAAGALPSRIATPHWREFRANLVKQQPGRPQRWPPRTAPGGGDEAWWVHELPAPEQGCVLLAQPCCNGRAACRCTLQRDGGCLLVDIR